MITVLDLESHFEKLGEDFCFDTETAMAPASFGGWNNVRLLQFANEDGYEFYLDTLELGRAELRYIKELLERKTLTITCQNAVFDCRVMRGCGVYLGGKPSADHLPNFYDTFIASQVLYNGNSLKHDLGSIVKRELEVELDKSLQKNDWMNAELNEAELAYAMADVRYTLAASQTLHSKIVEQGLYDVYKLECSLISCIVEMEHTGMYVDPDALSECVSYYEATAKTTKAAFIGALHERLVDAGLKGLPMDEDGSFNLRAKPTGTVRAGTKKPAGFNINAPKQILEKFNQLGFQPTTEAGKPSLDRKVLAVHQAEELVRMLLSFKRVNKRQQMAESLQESCGEDHRIRARFNPLATATGRFSSSSPNLQQVPRDKEFRCAFKAPPGRVLAVADFSGMELRIAAVVAGEQKMLDAFNEGADIHTRTTALMYGIPEREVDRQKRAAGKSCNFGLLFSAGPKGLVNYFATVGVFISQKEGKEFHKMWHEAYPAFGKWHRQCDARARAKSPSFTVIGRRRYMFSTDTNSVTTQSNSVIQGTGADITKAAMIEIHRKLPDTARLIATIHDEILIECDEADGESVLKMMLAEMEDAGLSVLGNGVRLIGEGSVAPSWGEAK
jgi:DNA polymerase I-like protein with 3'-5' exonuclease and polymerase domains